MQIKTFFQFILFTSILFSKNTFAYDCLAKELPMKAFRNKKEAFAQLRSGPRQAVVSGALYELTAGEITKKNAKKAEVLINYLENSEVNADQRSFFKLLGVSSEITGSNPKKLKLNEVCEIMDKVNGLVK